MRISLNSQKNTFNLATKMFTLLMFVVKIGW